MSVTHDEVGVAGVNRAPKPSTRKTARIEAMDRHVAKRIREARATRGLTMAALGEAIGVTMGQVEKYERGENSVVPGRLHAIARVLNVEPGWFFRDFPPDLGVPFEAMLETAEHLHGDTIEIAAEIHALPPTQRRIVRDLIKQLRTTMEASPGPAGPAAPQ